jgi:uncharacterized integral membrane protein
MRNLDRGTGVYAGFIGLLVIVAGLVVLAAQNTESVTLRWLGFEWNAPLVAVLLATMLVAVVLDEMIGAIWRSRRRRIRAERLELDAHRADRAAELAGASDEQEAS